MEQLEKETDKEGFLKSLVPVGSRKALGNLSRKLVALLFSNDYRE
jgi:hypothetical protein